MAERFEKAIEEANHLKQAIENEIHSFEHTVSLIDNFGKNGQFDNHDDFSEDDALMINDSVYEFSTENDAKPSRNQLQLKLEETFTKIESLMNEKLSIDNMLNDLSSGMLSEKTIKLVKCLPDLTGSCIGHLKNNYTNGESSAESSACDQLDHSQFKMETQLSENFSFKKLGKCSITFSCPDASRHADNKQKVHENLKIDFYDSQHNCVRFDLKEKLTSTHRFIKICFVPQTAGIFKLAIKFKNINIQNSPFHFVVLSNQIPLAPSVSNSSLNSDNSFHSAEQGSGILEVKAEKIEHQDIFKTHQLPLAETLTPPSSAYTNQQQPVVNTVDLSQGFPSIFAGRGRLLKMKNSNTPSASSSLFSNKSVMSNPVNITASVSQKRKSPSQLSDANNNFINDGDVVMETEEEGLVKEIANKLKKVVCVDESINKYHNYSMQSISSVLSLNVHTNSTSNLNIDNANNQLKSNTNGLLSLNILSDHIRKYTNPSHNGLVRLMEDKIPPLKAQFLRKYPNCNFPIGVRSCKMRNWLIVCDNGNNSIKIFERTNGELLREIKEDPAQNYTLCRPSAVLINETNSEIYVKDDKEILVFDLEQDCKLLRKFGNRILRKPYGLAYDNNGNLVLVDVDFKNPLIYTFDRITGKVLNSKPYQPALKAYADSHNLKEAFGSKKILGNNLVPFDKSKVRFICSNQNSLYAADLGRSIIYKTNLDGEIELAFGFQGRRHGELNEPSGVYADSDGNAILVGDSKNDRIQVCSKSFLTHFFLIV